MTNVLRLSAITAAMFMGTAAQAVVVLTSTQTLHFTPAIGNTSQTLSFNRFDPGVLGAGTRYTLTGVMLSYLPDATAPLSTVTITSNSGNRRIVAATVTAQSTITFTTAPGTSFSFGSNLTGISAAADFSTGVSPGQANGLTRTVSIAYNPVSSFGSTAVGAPAVASFVGTGLVSVNNTLTNYAASTSIVGTGGNGNGVVSGGQVGGDVMVTYTYVDELPEPGSWVSMLAGFALVGTAMRRRVALA